MMLYGCIVFCLTCSDDVRFAVFYDVRHHPVYITLPNFFKFIVHMLLSFPFISSRGCPVRFSLLETIELSFRSTHCMPMYVQLIA
jgi:hypothetical protein